MHNIYSSMSSHHFPRRSASFKKIKNAKIRKGFFFFFFQNHRMIQTINVLDMNKLVPARLCPSHLSGLNLLGLGELCILPNL